MSPLVSIALCTYNAGKFLTPLLESILQQTWKNIEIVCCDDKSADDTVITLENLRRQYPEKFKIYVNDNNLGYIRNFEKCLSLCSGSFIAIADHDDIWNPHKVERLVNAIGNALMVYSDSVHIDEDDIVLGKKIGDTFRLHTHPHPNAFIFYDFIWGHSTLIRRELLEYALPVPEKIPYDTWLAYTAASVSHVNYVDEPLTGWRQHSHSFTAVMYKKNEQGRTDKNRKYEEFGEKSERIRTLSDNIYCINKRFMEALYSKYGSIDKGFSWNLFFFLTWHQNTLFSIWRRNYLSRLNEFRKMSRRVKKWP